MANFEGLIRGALATRDAGNPAIRKQIYQSSRNALNRLLEDNRSLTVEAALNQQKMLEETIQQIEAEYIEAENTPSETHQPVIPSHHSVESVLPQQSGELPESAATDRTPEPPLQPEGHVLETGQESAALDPLQELQSLLRGQVSQPARPAPPEAAHPGHENIVAEPVPAASASQAATQAHQPHQEDFVSVNEEDIRLHGNQVTGASSPVAADDFVEDRAPPAGFSKRRRLQKRFLAVGIFLGLAALLLWIAYVVVIGYLDGSLFQAGTERRGPENSGIELGQTEDGEYITIIEPGDLSSLVTAGRGESEIVNQLNAEMIRIVSVRDGESRSEPARPILIKIQPGILQEIAGKSVNVEIYAKSGGNSPATFSVECQFGALGECGRKRFRIGLQPEAVVFSVAMRQGELSGSEAYLAINTDITGTAEITGRGDVLDIVYARLRPVP